MTQSAPDLRQRGSLVFSHMGFYVRDLERIARFYKDVLCFTETDRATWATFSGSRMLLRRGLPPRDCLGIAASGEAAVNCERAFLGNFSP